MHLRGNLVSVVIALAVLTPGSGRAQALYGITQTTNQLITIDTTTGAGTLVGTLSPGMRTFGLAFRGSNLYTWDAMTFRIQQLDPATAATLGTIDIGSTAFGEGEITFRSDGIGFLCSVAPPQLTRFDLSVPSSTVIGPLTPNIDGLAFNAAGVLYRLAEGGTDLYTMDPATGATTLFGSTGVSVSANGLGGLAFDQAGNLFAVLSNGSGSPSSLYGINTTTVAATLIGPIGFNGVCGLAFAPAAPPPPPPPVPPPPPPSSPSGAGAEGTYPGSTGSPGPEGAFGLGGRSRRAPALLGPFLESTAGARNFRISSSIEHLPRPGLQLAVFNVSHRQKTSSPEQGIPAAWLVSGTLLGLIALIVGTSIRS